MLTPVLCASLIRAIDVNTMEIQALTSTQCNISITLGSRQRLSGAHGDPGQTDDAVLVSRWPCRPDLPSDRHGGHRCGRGRSRTLAQQLRQPGNLSQAPQAVAQIGPKTHAELPAGLLQRRERVPAAPPGVTARAAADLARLHVTADDRLRA